MLGLAAGIASAGARIDALERDRKRIDDEIEKLRRYAHDLRATGLPGSWEKMADALRTLDDATGSLRGEIGRLQGCVDTFAEFRKELEAPGGPLEQTRELGDRRRAVKRLVIWGGSLSIVVTTVLNVGYLLWKWVREW